MATTMISEDCCAVQENVNEVRVSPPVEEASAPEAENNGGARGTSPTSDTNDGGEPAVMTTTAKKQRNKELSKAKRREDKTLEQVLKALSSLETTEEKLAALCKKYTDLLEEHRQLQTRFKQNQKSLTSLVKEKEQLQSEHSKAVLAKSKLESLCRELQRHNKLIKEESLGRAKEEEEKRKEVTNKFQTTINDIQSQMNEHYQKNTKLREENMELAGKLKSLIEQYETREQHIEKILAHKDLEKQLVEAKMAQSTLLMTEEKEKSLKERETLLKETSEAHKRIVLMEATEQALKEQVGLYTEKYEDFQSTLSKSNDVFQSFKTEMDKMTKKIKKLEKETTMWRSRWENSNKALLEMAEDRAMQEKRAVTQQVKISKLESLCRVMQEERRATKEATPTPSTEESKSSESEAKPVSEDTAAEPASETAEKPASDGSAEVTASEGTAETTASADTAENSASGDASSAETVAEAVANSQSQRNGSPVKNMQPTKTPPNTPDEGGCRSRASPVTVDTSQESSDQSGGGAATQPTTDQSGAASQGSDDQSGASVQASLEQVDSVDKTEEKTAEGDSACPN